MTLLGKILAVLNILGAAGLICVVALDYGKRRAWTYAVFRHELVVQGLPIDTQHKNAQGVPLVDLLGEETPKELFAQAGGSPVTTQVAEVERVDGLLKAKVAAAATPELKMVAWSRILLPLAKTNLEREHLLACRAWLSNKAATDKLEATLKTAFDSAVASVPEAGKPLKPFDQLFLTALREQSGDPLDPFAGLVARLAPATQAEAKAIKFHELFLAVLEAEHKALEASYTSSVTEALKGETGAEGTPRKSLTGDPRRVSLAQFLFAVTPLLAEDALASGTPSDRDAKLLAGLAPDSAAYADRVIETDAYRTAYRRVLTIVGLEAALNAVTAEAAVVQSITGELGRERVSDRLGFIATHQQVVDTLRDRATEVASEVALLGRRQKALEEQKTLVGRRQADVAKYEMELDASRVATALEMDKLRNMSERLFKLRLILRDTEVANKEGHKKIVELERKIQELENTSSPSRADN